MFLHKLLLLDNIHKYALYSRELQNYAAQVFLEKNILIFGIVHVVVLRKAIKYQYNVHVVKLHHQVIHQC